MEAPAIGQLWRLVQRRGAIDARVLFDTLAEIRRDADHADPRTRLLVRTARSVLSDRLGSEIVEKRLGADVPWTDSDAGEFLDGRGFHSLQKRVIDVTDPESVLEMLRVLGRRVRQHSTIYIGGALSLIMSGVLSRETEDADLVDELPDAFRSEHALLEELHQRYKLQLTHFQSHYLPEGWKLRVRSLGEFGSVTAFLVDPLDMLTCKLFSSRLKDFQDVTDAWPLIDREEFANRIRRTTTAWRSEPKMLAAAMEHWYTLTGEESLPS